MVEPPKTTDRSSNSGGSDNSNPPKPDHKDPYFTSSSDLSGNIITPIVLRSTNYDEWARWIRLSFTSTRKITFLEAVKAELAVCIQTPSMSIKAYFGKLQLLWDELHNLTLLPTCNCGGITEQLINMSLEERYNNCMYGLNRELYGTIWSALNTQDPLTSLDTAYQKIREEESMRKATDTSLGTELVALSLRSGTRLLNYGEKSKLSCIHCMKQGHDITTCFLKVGYPKWWETRHQRVHVEIYY
ncbi:hypothetical protein LIER_10954 [Lithospermum erythrorhizon]|uniref:Retrotransposon Copia-like N-terminal domain-containing protein n=1 Tax=Lithospermum erythrorhizon TaxID=34254 RepID=A0AAV3PL45_LITER